MNLLEGENMSFAKTMDKAIKACDDSKFVSSLKGQMYGELKGVKSISKKKEIVNKYIDWANRARISKRFTEQEYNEFVNNAKSLLN